MKFRFGHEVDIGTDETSAFSLPAPWRRRSDNGLSTRDIHKLEEEPGEVLNDPLHDSELSKII